MTMASYRDQAFFLSLALFLAVLITAPYVAHGNFNLTIAGVRAIGKLFCTRTGNLAIGLSQPLVGANVTLSCSNTSASVSTNANGLFNVRSPTDVNLKLNLTLPPLLPNCNVTVQLPVQGCQLLPRTGNLTGILVPIGLSVDPGLTGLILDLLVKGFTLIP